jgi:hypothetical protein
MPNIITGQAGTPANKDYYPENKSGKYAKYVPIWV